MMLKDRLDHLRGIVKTEKKVKVTELSQRFDVTEETIRRDLERLELEGLITRTHGGAVLKVENMFDRLGYTHRSRTNVEEKKKIAQIVASIIPMQATLFADASSTVMEALTLMADHTKFDRTSFVKYRNFQQIDVLVTDRRPADQWMELFEEYQIRVLYPEAEDVYIKETGNS
nr:DeoR/GlpR family DNA-binding transcription regulator [Enterocloster clostridioformis]